MASETRPGAAIARRLSELARKAGNLRGVRVAAAAAVSVVLAATLLFLYYKTQGADFKRQADVLAQLRELKEIDANWDLEVLRARTGTEPRTKRAQGPDTAEQLARVRRDLAAAAATVSSEVLERGLPGLDAALTEKAGLMARFRKANGETRTALERVMGAEVETAGLVRGAWQGYPNRERLVALENVVTQLLANAQDYYYDPDGERRKSLEGLISDLREAAPRLPPALQAGIGRFEANLRRLIEAKAIEMAVARKLAFLTAGPRVDSVTAAFSEEIEVSLTTRELYRIYLVAYAASLLILIGYLGVRLLASYRLLNQANAALKDANEGLEQRVAERTRDLSQALDQLKESEAQLIQSEKMSSLGQMVAGVAHEINTPLAYVKASLASVKKGLPQMTLLTGETEKLLNLLQSGAADPQQLSRQFALVQTLVKQIRGHQALEELQSLVGDGMHGIAQISDIVVNLKDFSRLDRSRVSLHDINQSIESTLLLAKHELKHVVVKKKLARIPPVTCAPSQINQVLLNIIANAAHAVDKSKGVITIASRTDGPDRVAVEIADNGSGIAPEVLPKIFDPFFTTKKVGQGTGLGLSIVYKIVKQHGGDIAVKSEVGVGTTFTVSLPLTPPEPGAEPPAPPAEEEAISPQML